MKNCWKRLISGALILALAGSTVLPALAAEPAGEEGSAQPLNVTVSTYTPKMNGSENIRSGETYTLIALPSDLAVSGGDGDVSTLTPNELLTASGEALFLGSAVAHGDGAVTFEDVRLRTADAVVYYVTGPGLDTPLYEATNTSTSASGRILTDTEGDHSATVSLVDAQTGYRYGNAVLADASGAYSFDSLAPGSYDLLVQKPGYLPTTRKAVDIPDNKAAFLNVLNLSSTDTTSGSSPVAGLSRVGDVNNDGVRDMADLAQLLLYYGQTSEAVPEGITADLSGDGAVDKTDSDLLIHAAAKPDVPDITTGTDATVTGASIAVADGGGEEASALRYLSFSLNTASTVSAAAFSLTFPADVVQPLNAKGGLIAPVDGSTVANCLVPAEGFDARCVSWRVEGDQVTLTFAVTADSPKAAGEVAKFYYRPASGSTASFYDGVFTLSHAVALAGRDTVVTTAALTYPGHGGGAVTAITIDTPTATTLTIPATGRTAVLALSATGSDGVNTYPDLSGVTWTVVDASGQPPAGVTVSQGLLTVTSEAAPGTISITASRGEVSSAPLTVTLEETPSVAYDVVIQKDGVSLEDDALTFAAGDRGAQSYTALVLDQYGVELVPQPEVSWALSGAPAGIALTGGASGGVLTSDGSTPAGTYSFYLLAQTEGLQRAIPVTLTLEPTLDKLFLSGAQSAVIPDEGAGVLSLTYAVTAVDKQGNPLSLTDDLEPTFSVSPAGQGVEAARDPVSGEYTVTASDAAQPGDYTLTAQLGEVAGTLTLTLQAPAQQPAVRAALFYDGQSLQTAQFSLPAGGESTLSFTAQLLDADGDMAASQPENWSWSLSADAPAGVSVPATGARGDLTVSAALAAGSYTFDLTAADPESGLAVSLPVTLTLTPTLGELVLTAPERLSIPAGEDLTYLLPVAAKDSLGEAMTPPEDLVWAVVSKGSSAAPAGVSVADGLLTVTSAAVPGDITLTVSDPSGKVKASADLTLDPAGEEESALVLYREVSVDGVTVIQNGPVSAADAIDAKEGQKVVFTYSAVLVDQTTGAVTAAPAAEVKWLGAAGGSFTVDANTESGVYPLNVTAVYGGQSASASAKVTVYPNITGLLLDFGDGDTATPYELAVPANGSTGYYSATLIAQIQRAGTSQNVPVRDLGLTDYDVTLVTGLTGLYATLDKATGTLKFTVDSAAVQNPTEAPSSGTDIRFIRLWMDYFPGETFRSGKLPFYLIPETSTVTSAILRRGTGTGTSFSFGTPKQDEVTAAEAGTFSNCYALELLDQYGAAVTDATVEWTLTVPDALMDGSTMLVTLAQPGEAMEKAYPNYASIRRLRISPKAPVGDYQLTLTAKAADMTCIIPIHLTVAPQPDVNSLSMTVSGAAAVTIPMYYAQYNSTTVNTNANSADYAAILRTALGGELDPDSRYSLDWTVVDADGNAPAGVTLSPASGSASATMKVTRAAQPTGTAESGKLRLTVTLTDTQSQEAISATTAVELSRSTAVPTVMSIYRGGSKVVSDSYSIAATDTSTVTRDYTFQLLDQYNQEAALKDRVQVAWTLTNSASSGVTLTTLKDDDGVAYARLSVKNPGYAVSKTVTLTAAITIAEEKATGGRVTVKYDLPVTVNIASSSSGGGSAGGGISGGTTTTTTGAPTSISISGNTYLNATYGTAASQTYLCTLRDSSGATCSSSYQSSVTWSASGLSGGISFNTATHVLSVPATTAAGVYKVILTARYSSSVSASVTVTVNVSNPSGGTPTSISITGSSAIAATQGTAVTKAWSATLKDASGNVTTVGQGSIIWALSTLSNGAVTVTFDANTATLTVPATAGVGTLNTTLTAKYGTLTATLPLTITVSAAQSSTAVAGPTIVPTVTLSGTTGTVALTTVQEKAITDAATTGAVVTIAPTGTSGLSSLSVSLTAATVKTMAQTHSQTLKVQTSLGTVILPAQTLTALAGQGGSDVTVTLTSSGGTVGVTFSCGYESASLPGAIVLSVPTTGNVAVRTDEAGGKQVVKKAVVKNGNLLTYLTGSAQLQLETRTPSFADTQSHWAKEAVTFTAARELFQGTSTTTFSPDATMTRSMLVTVLHRLEDTPAVSASSTFDDVAAGTWYTDAVSWANGKGIVQGTDDGFKPNDPVTREQLATILYRYAGSLGLSTSQTNNLSGFSDQSKVSSWARSAMQWAVGAGLINGKTGGVLDPTGNATRAEVSTILQRLITNVLAPSV